MNNDTKKLLEKEIARWVEFLSAEEMAQIIDVLVVTYTNAFGLEVLEDAPELEPELLDVSEAREYLKKYKL